MGCYIGTSCDLLTKPCFLHAIDQNAWKQCWSWNIHRKGSGLHKQNHYDWIVHYYSWFVTPEPQESIQYWERYALFSLGPNSDTLQYHSVPTLPHAFLFGNAQQYHQTQFLTIFPDFSHHYFLKTSVGVQQILRSDLSDLTLVVVSWSTLQRIGMILFCLQKWSSWAL